MKKKILIAFPIVIIFVLLVVLFYVELPPQELSAPERNGFSVIEWGGTDIKNNID